ncbi:MAG: hypothetical protein V4729_09025 [Pseudomonadota bacterium]
MNHDHPRLIVALSLALLMAACTAAAPVPYRSMQARLQQQMETLSALDRQLDNAGDDRSRQQLLAEREKAVREANVLLHAALAERLAVSRDCLKREKFLPESAKTCYELETVEETQARMMVMLLDYMARGAAGM